MTEIIDRTYLRKHLAEKKKHDTGRVMDVVPFLSKRTQSLTTQFYKMIGEYVRHITEIKVGDKAISSEILEYETEKNILSEHIASKIEFEDDEARYDFVRFIDEYLFKQERMNTIHPYLFNFIPIEKKLTNEFSKYAEFMQDVLLQKERNITDFFCDKEANDILTELIITNLDILTKKGNGANTKKSSYQPFLNHISELYREDLNFLTQYKEYFIQAFPMLTHHYAFMYVCQLLWNLEQYEGGAMNEVYPFYYAFEWESLTKRREAAHPVKGYKFVQERSENLFPHIHTLSQLSHNKLNADYLESEPWAVMSYHEIYTKVSSKGEEYKAHFLSDLNGWINDYCSWQNIPLPQESDSLEDALRTLFKCLKEGTSSTVATKFGKNIEDLGSSMFLKRRGSIGYVFNLKHEFILLLVAISVKNERIPLNQLYEELEKRGVALDYYSRQELVNLLDSHNILDKKSDSGDAQYVKPIL
ncbi:DNA phosphorothioation-dependent restriction protein DptG [Planococcus maritimus]|uniref:DNA phosphorothioation-dependent restriction protein DptG n=1 Tax=Planococcus maritimus TaxID=192421 RepID=UPI00084CD9DF|nr:DNA phosphorothioation-dependent restriction protein DptG [Planococcus maritimus]OED33576.1 DNA phosphorothioation-dependent restriction protein DptG [Planococcus maritimus]